MEIAPLQGGLFPSVVWARLWPQSRRRIMNFGMDVYDAGNPLFLVRRGEFYGAVLWLSVSVSAAQKSDANLH